MVIQADATNMPLADESIDLIVTDPPYGISYQSNSQGVDRKSSLGTGNKKAATKEKFFTKIQNDDTVPVDWLVDAYRVLKDASACYVFCRWDKQHIVINAAEFVGFKTKNAIVLFKSNHGMGDLKGAYAPTYETLLFFSKGRHLLHKRLKDVWEVPVKFSGAHWFHPCEKPTSWMAPAIENSSNKGGVVLDPFCGSASTGVAAQQLRRKFIGLDIDLQWLSDANKRAA